MTIIKASGLTNCSPANFAAGNLKMDSKTLSPEDWAAVVKDVVGLCKPCFKAYIPFPGFVKIRDILNGVRERTLFIARDNLATLSQGLAYDTPILPLSLMDIPKDKAFPGEEKPRSELERFEGMFLFVNASGDFGSFSQVWERARSDTDYDYVATYLLANFRLIEYEELARLFSCNQAMVLKVGGIIINRLLSLLGGHISDSRKCLADLILLEYQVKEVAERFHYLPQDTLFY